MTADSLASFPRKAIAFAQTLGQSAEAYVVTVAMAAVTAMLTPISHHNLIIYGPGGYRFTDYVRMGVPLTLVLGIAVALVTPRVWPG